MSTTAIRTEEYRTQGERLVTKVRELIREGNVRRIIIKSEEGKTLVELPLTIGVVGALLLPAWAAIGAIASLVTDCSIVVEREEQPETAAQRRVQVPFPHHPTPAELAAIPEEEWQVDEQC